MRIKITKENGKMPFWLIFTFILIIVANYLIKKETVIKPSLFICKIYKLIPNSIFLPSNNSLHNPKRLLLRYEMVFRNQLISTSTY